MERYEKKTENTKATVEKPWVFTVGQDLSDIQLSIQTLIDQRIIILPIFKRSLFVLSSNIALEGATTSNLISLNAATTEEDVENISNPAMSIAASSSKILDYISKGQLDLERFGRIIACNFNLDSQSNSAFNQELQEIISKVKNNSIEVILYTDQQELPTAFENSIHKSLRRPQASKQETAPEAKKEKPVYSKKEEVQIDFDVLQQKIKENLKNIESYAKPEDLEKVKALIKKNVPFGRRTYYAAYLMLLGLNTRPYSPKKPMGERGPRPIKDSNSKNFYINVGAQDKVSIKDLENLIMEKSGLKKEDILSITFKSSYSFFTVSAENAQAVVSTMTETNMGEKVVKVNFAKTSPQRDSKPRKKFVKPQVESAK